MKENFNIKVGKCVYLKSKWREKDAGEREEITGKNEKLKRIKQRSGDQRATGHENGF